MPSFKFKDVRTDSNEIDYELGDRTSKQITESDTKIIDGDRTKMAVEFQAKIQSQIDSVILQDDLPRDDVERGFTAGDFEDAYPNGNVFLEIRGSDLVVVTRNEVVSVTFDSVNGVYNVKVSDVG